MNGARRLAPVAPERGKTNQVEENGDNDSIRDGDTERGRIIGVTWWGGRGKGGENRKHT